MAQYTERLNLIKPDRTENYSVLNENGNMDIIDENVVLQEDFNDITEATKNLYLAGDKVEFTKNTGYFEIGNTLLEGHTYTLSADIDSTDTDGDICRVYVVESLENHAERANVTIAKGTHTSVTFTIANSNASAIIFYAGKTSSASAGDVASFTNVQIEEGSAATEYVKPITAVDIVARSLEDIIVRNDYGKETTWYALGDSITAGVYSFVTEGTADNEFDPTKVWSNHFKKMRNYNLVNLAVRGMGYCQYSSAGTGSQKLKDIIDNNTFTNKGIITVFLGINDYNNNRYDGTNVTYLGDENSTAWDNTVSGNIKGCIESLQAKTTNPIVLITPLNSWNKGTVETHYSRKHKNNGTAEYTLDDLTEIIEYWADFYGLNVINLTKAATINQTNMLTYLADKVHPTEEGHILLARELNAKIPFI